MPAISAINLNMRLFPPTVTLMQQSSIISINPRSTASTLRPYTVARLLCHSLTFSMLIADAIHEKTPQNLQLFRALCIIPAGGPCPILFLGEYDALRRSKPKRAVETKPEAFSRDFPSPNPCWPLHQRIVARYQAATLYVWSLPSKRVHFPVPSLA